MFGYFVGGRKYFSEILRVIFDFRCVGVYLFFFRLYSRKFCKVSLYIVMRLLEVIWRVGRVLDKFLG